MSRLSILNRLPLAPVIGAMFGVVAAILVLATPQWLFENGVVASGLPGLLAAAAPPLGAKAKILSALLAAALVSAFLWGAVTFVERLLESRRMVRTAETADQSDDARTLDQILADRRRPIFAEADLGAPLMSDEAAAVARDELVLDIALPEADEPDPRFTPPPIAISPADVQVESDTVAETEAQPISWPRHRAENGDEASGHETVAELMSRLEAALERREHRLGKNAPMPGDISSLRAALGLRAGS